MKLLVTRPEHDPTTRYISCWAGVIINLAKCKGFRVLDLHRGKANRKEFEGRMKKLHPELIFLNGHGNDKSIAGHDNETLVGLEDNHQVLSGKVTYALACSAGKLLGPAIVKEEAIFIGYSDKFIFMHDFKYMSKPLQDPKAKPFMEASNQVMISLLKGHEPQEASRRSKEKFKEHYKLLSSEADSDSSQMAQFLWWNMRHQVCLGNDGKNN
ncbi:MAG: hypothetical protein AAB723_03455 [Patescibacteria group bacterium]